MLSLNLRTIKDIHRALYRELVEWFGLPSRVAIDCYRDALANAKTWKSTLAEVGGLELRDYQCYCQVTGLEMATWRL